MKSNTKTIKDSYWIIINYKKNSIWKKVFFSYPEAKAELDTQVLTHGNNPDWKIEQKEWYRETAESDNGEFANF